MTEKNKEVVTGDGNGSEVDESSGRWLVFLIIGGILLVVLVGVVAAIGHKKKWYQGGVEV